jgi:ADP-heptose:LPS heptosyltransferase
MYWRVLGRALGFEVPPLEIVARPHENQILVHTGAAQAVRVWPLSKYRDLLQRMRDAGGSTILVCDPNQVVEWQAVGEKPVVPQRISEYLEALRRSAVFVGNDSGPAHIAALKGVPTFTIFGPQLPEWFRPEHPEGVVMEGKPCPYKPCRDYCRFPRPFCIQDLEVGEVWDRLQPFLEKHRAMPARREVN